MIYYGVNEISEAYNITPASLKYKIKTGKLKAKKIIWGGVNNQLYKYVIPSDELAKLEYCRVSSPRFVKNSQPDYCEKRLAKKEHERRLSELERERTIAKLRSPKLYEFKKNGYQGYKDYIHSVEWFTLRDARQAYDNHRCQHCGSETKTLQCHHKTYKHLYMQSEFFDLITLCVDCHHDLHERLKRLKKHTAECE